MKVLIVEDDEVSLKLITSLVEKQGHTVIQTTDATMAYENIKMFTEPFVIILDWLMPGMEGSTLCELTRKTDIPYQPFIIMLTSKNSINDQLTALDMGADMFLTKPIEPAVIIANLRVASRIVQQQNEAIQLQEELKKLANIDGLTGINNRRFGLEMLTMNLERLGRQKEDKTGCIILCDIDDFKSINDRFGHSTGDEVLIEFCKRINRQIRPFDEFCRYGGEEFLLYCEIDEQDMPSFLERLRNAVEINGFHLISEDIKITASFGVVSFTSKLLQTTSLNELIIESDNALYKAKEGGKNQVVFSKLKIKP